MFCKQTSKKCSKYWSTASFVWLDTIEFAWVMSCCYAIQHHSNKIKVNIANTVKCLERYSPYQNIPVILFCVLLLLSGLETLASVLGFLGMAWVGVDIVIGDLLNAAGTADAGTSCQANLWAPGKGISFAKSKPHLWLSNSNCLVNSRSTNLLFSSLSVQPKRFLLTPSRAVTPLTRRALVSSTVDCSGALTLSVDISKVTEVHSTLPL